MATLTDSAADPIADHALIEEEVSIAKTIHACVRSAWFLQLVVYMTHYIIVD